MVRFSLLVLVVLGLAAAGPSVASAPSAGALLTDLGFNLGEQASVREGEIIARDLPRERENELAAVAAVLIPSPLPHVEGILLNHYQLEPAERIHVPIDSTKPEGPAFSASELKRIAKVAPGSEFNLSSSEIETLRLQATGDAAAAYRDILMQRVTAYSGEGLAGIAPYARRFGAASSPGAELQTATRAAAAMLTKYFPKFAQALAFYPDGMSNGIESHLGWQANTVDGRPSVALAHDLVDRTHQYCVAAHRQFYVSHTYNSLQRITVLVPTREGTLAVAFNRTFTDRVAGPFSGFEKEIGQKMLRGSLTADLGDMRRRATTGGG